MTGIEVLTAGRYGYADRRIHRDDFAHQLAIMLPADDGERLLPAVAVTTEDLVSAAKRCRHLAERYPAEPLGRLAVQIAYRLEHPITHPGAMVFYAAALLCREQEALSRVESATMVAAVLEARAAAHVADMLEATAPQTLRYSVKSAIDGDFVRGARHLKARQN
jgi:hypothetical protein